MAVLPVVPLVAGAEAVALAVEAAVPLGVPDGQAVLSAEELRITQGIRNGIHGAAGARAVADLAAAAVPVGIREVRVGYAGAGDAGVAVAVAGRRAADADVDALAHVADLDAVAALAVRVLVAVEAVGELQLAVIGEQAVEGPVVAVVARPRGELLDAVRVDLAGVLAGVGDAEVREAGGVAGGHTGARAGAEAGALEQGDVTVAVRDAVRGPAGGGAVPEGARARPAVAREAAGVGGGGGAVVVGIRARDRAHASAEAVTDVAVAQALGLAVGVVGALGALTGAELHELGVRGVLDAGARRVGRRPDAPDEVLGVVVRPHPDREALVGVEAAQVGPGDPQLGAAVAAPAAVVGPAARREGADVLGRVPAARAVPRGVGDAVALVDHHRVLGPAEAGEGHAAIGRGRALIGVRILVDVEGHVDVVVLEVRALPGDVDVRVVPGEEVVDAGRAGAEAVTHRVEVVGAVVVPIDGDRVARVPGEAAALADAVAAQVAAHAVGGAALGQAVRILVADLTVGELVRAGPAVAGAAVHARGVVHAGGGADRVLVRGAVTDRVREAAALDALGRHRRGAGRIIVDGLGAAGAGRGRRVDAGPLAVVAVAADRGGAVGRVAEGRVARGHAVLAGRAAGLLPRGAVAVAADALPVARAGVAVHLVVVAVLQRVGPDGAVGAGDAVVVVDADRRTGRDGLILGAVAEIIGVGRAVDQGVAGRVVVDGRGGLAGEGHADRVLAGALTGGGARAPGRDVVGQAAAVAVAGAAVARGAAEAVLAVVADALVVAEAVALVAVVAVLVVRDAHAGVAVRVRVAVRVAGAARRARGGLIDRRVAVDREVVAAVAVQDGDAAVGVVLGEVVAALEAGADLVLAGPLAGARGGAALGIAEVLVQGVHDADVVGALGPVRAADLAVGAADAVLAVEPAVAVALLVAELAQVQEIHAGPRRIARGPVAVAAGVTDRVVVAAGRRAAGEGIVLILVVAADRVGAAVGAGRGQEAVTSRVVVDVRRDALVVDAEGLHAVPLAVRCGVAGRVDPVGHRAAVLAVAQDRAAVAGARAVAAEAVPAEVRGAHVLVVADLAVVQEGRVDDIDRPVVQGPDVAGRAVGDGEGPGSVGVEVVQVREGARHVDRIRDLVDLVEVVDGAAGGLVEGHGLVAVGQGEGELTLVGVLEHHLDVDLIDIVGRVREGHRGGRGGLIGHGLGAVVAIEGLVVGDRGAGPREPAGHVAVVIVAALRVGGAGGGAVLRHDVDAPGHRVAAVVGAGVAVVAVHVAVHAAVRRGIAVVEVDAGVDVVAGIRVERAEAAGLAQLDLAGVDGAEAAVVTLRVLDALLLGGDDEEGPGGEGAVVGHALVGDREGPVPVLSLADELVHLVGVEPEVVGEVVVLSVVRRIRGLEVRGVAAVLEGDREIAAVVVGEVELDVELLDQVGPGHGDRGGHVGAVGDRLGRVR